MLLCVSVRAALLLPPLPVGRERTGHRRRRRRAPLPRSALPRRRSPPAPPLRQNCKTGGSCPACTLCRGEGEGRLGGWAGQGVPGVLAREGKCLQGSSERDPGCRRAIPAGAAAARARCDPCSTCTRLSSVTGRPDASPGDKGSAVCRGQEGAAILAPAAAKRAQPRPIEWGFATKARWGWWRKGTAPTWVRSSRRLSPFAGPLPSRRPLAQYELTSHKPSQGSWRPQKQPSAPLPLPTVPRKCTGQALQTMCASWCGSAHHAPSSLHMESRACGTGVGRCASARRLAAASLPQPPLPQPPTAGLHVPAIHSLRFRQQASDSDAAAGGRALVSEPHPPFFASLCSRCTAGEAAAEQARSCCAMPCCCVQPLCCQTTGPCYPAG